MRQIHRPRSPHLQIYKLPPTALASITHRITGVALSLGFLLIPLVLCSLISGRESFHFLQSIMGSSLGRLLLLAWCASLIFHLCHGIRHLLWDAGLGFEKKIMNKVVIAELTVTFVLVVGAWFLSTTI